jgi:CBS domain-containing protein
MHDRASARCWSPTPEGGALGILTRHDMLDRVTCCAARPLDVPIAEVMSAPVHTLDVRAARARRRAADVARRRAPRAHHRRGRVVGIVSERDLFALQRLSLRQLGARHRRRRQRERCCSQAAADIRRFASQLLAQGVRARQLTELISHLNDRLAARCYALLAPQHGLDPMQALLAGLRLRRAGEQTIATDQDNGLIVPREATPRPGTRLGARPSTRRWTPAATRCAEGGVMAGRRPAA